MLVKITTDGSCHPNPGPGGWACIFRMGPHCKALYGYSEKSTNIKMEITAAIMALEHLRFPCEVELTTDSEYVVKGITTWIHKWKKNGWVTASWGNTPSKEVLNKDLWERLDKATERHRISWVWVKGHKDHKDNILADQLAGKARTEKIQGTLVIGNEPEQVVGAIRALNLESDSI